MLPVKFPRIKSDPMRRLPNTPEVYFLRAGCESYEKNVYYYHPSYGNYSILSSNQIKVAAIAKTKVK